MMCGGSKLGGWLGATRICKYYGVVMSGAHKLVRAMVCVGPEMRLEIRMHVCVFRNLETKLALM